MGDKTTIYTNNLFEQPWWLDIVAPGCWREITVIQKDEVVGRFPYVYKNGNIKMPPLTQTCGIWLKEQSSKKGNEVLSIQKSIIDEVIEKLPSHKSVCVALDSSVKYFLPFIWKGYEVKPRVSYRITDLSDLEEVYSNFGKTVVKNIKSATKKVEISCETNLDWLLDSLDKTFEIQNRKNPISRDLVKKIVETTQSRGAGIMITAKDSEGNIHASSYFVFDENVFYYLLAGSNPEYRTSGAQTLILWEAIKYAQKKSKIFDFEGSMIEGIENFVRRFGGEPVVYYEIRKGTVMNDLKTMLKPRVKRLIGYKL